jgi:hypothetical protein
LDIFPSLICFQAKGSEAAGPAASVARPASSSPPIASPVKASNDISSKNDNNVEIARERDLGADDYEDEQPGMENPFQ